MANAAYGLEFSRTLHGGTPVTKRFYIPSTNSTALFKNDVVELVNTTGAMDPKGEVPQITQFVTGHIPLGVVSNFGVDSSAVLTGNYRAASTNRYVDVIVDPDACYYAMQDDVAGAMTQASIGALTNCALIIGSGSTATGYSGTMVDSSQVTASAADVKVIGIKADSVNVGAATACELEVVLMGAAIRATDSQS